MAFRNFLYDVERQRGVLVDFGLAEVRHQGLVQIKRMLNSPSARGQKPPIAYAWTHLRIGE